MARFFAMRVAKGRLDYSEVPEVYKADVKQILIEDYGWKESDFPQV